MDEAFTKFFDAEQLEEDYGGTLSRCVYWDCSESHCETANTSMKCTGRRSESTMMKFNDLKLKEKKPMPQGEQGELKSYDAISDLQV